MKKRSKNIKDKININSYDRATKNLNSIIRSIKNYVIKNNTNYTINYVNSLKLDELVNEYCKLKDLGIVVSGREAAINAIYNLYASKKVRIKQNTNDTPIERSFEDKLKSLNIKYVKQLKVGKYFCDFYLPEYKTIIECDGFKHHHTYEDLMKDHERQNFIILSGYRILRYTGRKINSDGDWLEKDLKWLGSSQMNLGDAGNPKRD